MTSIPGALLSSVAKAGAAEAAPPPVPVFAGSSPALNSVLVGLPGDFRPERAFFNAKGDPVSEDACRDWVHGRGIALYFSASWCSPCKSFTPKLVHFLSAAPHSSAYVGILVPLDRTERGAKEYMKHMPNMLSVDFDTDNVQHLQDKFGVKSIPHLVLLDSEGREQTRDGVAKVALALERSTTH
jgi:thiol-disulfide isomerase/thioredoxin